MHLRGFDISNGCQDHTTSPYAATSIHTSCRPCAASRNANEGVEAPFVRRTGRSLTGEACPAIPCAPDAAASTASHPAFVTTRDPPLWWGETGKLIEVICPTAKAKYFCAAHLDMWNRPEFAALNPPNAHVQRVHETPIDHNSPILPKAVVASPSDN